MNTAKMEEIYNDLARILDEMIPEDWSEIYLYAQLAESMYTMYFFYYTKNKEKLVYSFDIPKNYEIDEDEFDSLRDKMKESFKHLQNEFIKNNQEPWTNLTLTIKETNKLYVDYGYDDVSAIDPFEQQVIWRYEVLGNDLSSQSNLAKKILEKHLKSKE
jgi:uncharacterized protein (TIGR01741 family)